MAFSGKTFPQNRSTETSKSARLSVYCGTLCYYFVESIDYNIALTEQLIHYKLRQLRQTTDASKDHLKNQARDTYPRKY